LRGGKLPVEGNTRGQVQKKMAYMTLSGSSKGRRRLRNVRQNQGEGCVSGVLV